MDMKREGTLFNGKPGMGIVLSIELSAADRNLIANGERVGMRMASATQGTPAGWEMMSRASVELYDTRRPTRTNLPASVRIDPGGDLYFGIHNNEALHNLPEFRAVTDFEDLETFVDYDQSGYLTRHGIQVISIYGLRAVANLLRPNGNL